MRTIILLGRVINKGSVCAHYRNVMTKAENDVFEDPKKKKKTDWFKDRSFEGHAEKAKEKWILWKQNS